MRDRGRKRERKREDWCCGGVLSSCRFISGRGGIDIDLSVHGACDGSPVACRVNVPGSVIGATAGDLHQGGTQDLMEL